MSYESRVIGPESRRPALFKQARHQQCGFLAKGQVLSQLATGSGEFLCGLLSGPAQGIDAPADLAFGRAIVIEKDKQAFTGLFRLGCRAFLSCSRPNSSLQVFSSLRTAPSLAQLLDQCQAVRIWGLYTISAFALPPDILSPEPEPPKPPAEPEPPAAAPKPEPPRRWAPPAAPPLVPMATQAFCWSFLTFSNAGLMTFHCSSVAFTAGLSDCSLVWSVS